jgi:two-component system sensor histidine kinase UhpB
MKANKLELASLLWAGITLFVIVLLLLLDISRQKQTLQLESRVLYEFAYERTLINEVILHNFVELVETDYTDIDAIQQYAREIRGHYPHLRRLQIYQRVDPDHIAEHEQQMRDRGLLDYRIHRRADAAASSESSAYSATQVYPVVFVDPLDAYGLQLLGEDGYSVAANQNALMQSSYYLNAYATEPHPLEHGKMGYRLIHALDPTYTDADEARLMVALVLSLDDLIPPAAHISKGLSVTLEDGQGGILAWRDAPEVYGGWLLPELEERSAITRFGQTLELQVRKQLLWAETSWPFGLIVLLFSVVSYLIAAQGFRRRQEAAEDMLDLTRRLEQERDQLEQRVMERTQELVSRNSELRQQVKENRQLTQKILEVQESERRNIARELHDEMGQSLTAIRTDARLLQRHTKGDTTSLVHSAAVAIDTTAQRIYSVTYALMRALRPTALDDLGLVDALHQCIDSLHLKAQGAELHLQLSGALNELPEQVCIQCYRIVQEALNNCVKYAQADNLWLSVRLESDESGEPERLVIRIEDDGVGFDPKAQTKGFGLLGMRERALALDGRFDLGSTLGQGSWIQIELPITDLSFEIADQYQ